METASFQIQDPELKTIVRLIIVLTIQFIIMMFWQFKITFHKCRSLFNTVSQRSRLSVDSIRSESCMIRFIYYSFILLEEFDVCKDFIMKCLVMHKTHKIESNVNFTKYQYNWYFHLQIIKFMAQYLTQHMYFYSF